MKYAVYVEGQSEMYFVADVLQKYSNYDSVQCGLECINLVADDFKRMPFPCQGDLSSQKYYQIVNVNNDNKVISKLNKDVPGLLSKGFDIIIGVKDVYGQAYNSLVKEQKVYRDKIEALYQVQTQSINAHGAELRLHYAIMEYETWMLALIENFIIDNSGNLTAICDKFDLDLSQNLEDTIYHPSVVVQKIYNECGLAYNKHGKDSLAFLDSLTKDDYEDLRTSNKCPSFTKFLDSLLGGEKPILP